MPRNSSDRRICLVGELTGGVGVYGQNLLRGLSELGLRPTVVTPNPELLSVPAADVVAVRRFTGRGRWLPQALVFARAVRAIQHGFDLIHFTDARFSVFLPRGEGAVVGTMNDYFYAVTSCFGRTGTKDIYGDWFFRHLYYNLTRTLEGPCLRRLAHVICISSEVSRVLDRAYAISSDRRSVVPYGIAYGTTTNVGGVSPAPLILFAGGNFQRKGLRVLIEAGRIVLARCPTARFVVLGQSADLTLMRKLCAQRGVSSAFEFVGQVDYKRLYEFYSSATVFTMPSLLEAFGIPFLEAMHCGVPVVASDVPGPDFLRDRHNALMATTGDSTSLAMCLLEVLHDERLRKTLVENGKRTAERFTVLEMARRTNEVYEAAISMAHSSRPLSSLRS